MNWREHGACRLDPDMWFTGADRGAAVHICRRHCPVVRECHAELQHTEMTHGVMAGVAFASDGVRMAKWGVGLTVNVCGPYCRAYRKEQQSHDN